MGQSFLELLKQVGIEIVCSNDVNYVNGAYNGQMQIDGIDKDKNPVVYGTPTIEFDRLNTAGAPIALDFSTSGESVRMHYKFRVNTNVSNAIPLVLTEVKVVMHIKLEDGSMVNNDLVHFSVSTSSQIIEGEKSWNNINDFLAVKKAIEQNEEKANITWEGIVRWVDITSEEVQKNLKNPDYTPLPKNTALSGTIPIEAVPGSANHKSMFDGVKNLMCWDFEILNEKKVYFKDPLKEDAIYFLPQEYRIKALPNNAPDMRTEIVKENGENKVLMSFTIAPYIHPNAKRDAYRIFQKRKGKNYCELRYGGYENARFEYGGEMAGGKLYGEDGFTSIESEGSIEAGPDSHFFIVMKVPHDNLVSLFQDKIMTDGIVIGHVYFKVTDGIQNETLELDPIPVLLDLHKLAGIQPDVRELECTWPKYAANITNRGQYPIEIGGAAMSVLHWDDNKVKVKDARHDLKHRTAWPVILHTGESMKVEIDSDQAEKIKHKKLLGIGKVDTDYWNELVCEPYHIRVLDDSLKEIMVSTNESATYDHDTWTLSVICNFRWSDYPDLTALQIELKNKFGLDETVTLTNGDEKPKIPMVSNLNADMHSQQAGDRLFEYRIRIITMCGPKNPAWSDWAEDSGNMLFIYEEDISNLLTN